MTKEKKLKVPKRIAGVKVPKKIRKPVNKALAIAENPATRDLAVAALTAAAAALSERRAEGAADAPRRPGEAGTELDRAGRLTDVVVAAALDGARRLLDGLAVPTAEPGAEAPASPDAPAIPLPPPGRARRARASASAAAPGPDA